MAGGKQVLSFIAPGNMNWYSLCEKQSGDIYETESPLIQTSNLTPQTPASRNKGAHR